MSDELSDEEWAKFFELLDKVVNAPKPFTEKAAMVAEKSKEQDSDGNFAEFVGWYGGEVEEYDEGDEDNSTKE